MNAAPIFADEQFMSAQEKATVFRAWIGFLKNRFAYQQFTNALYEHLTLHCSFIAHYNRAGFHEFYFGEVSPSTFRFLDQFDPRKPGISAERYILDQWSNWRGPQSRNAGGRWTLCSQIARGMPARNETA